MTRVSVLLLLLLAPPPPASAQGALPAGAPRITLDLRAMPMEPSPPPSPRAARLRRGVLLSLRTGAAATLLGLLLLVRRQRRALTAGSAVEARRWGT